MPWTTNIPLSSMAGPVVPQPCVQTANISATGPALEIVVGILLLTIYPEIKRDVVSCLYESEQIPRYGRLEDSHYAGLRPQRYESLFQLDAFLASEGREPYHQHSLKTLTSSYNLDKLNSKESILYGSLVTCKGVGSRESLKRIRRIQRLQRTHGRDTIKSECGGSQA